MIAREKNRMIAREREREEIKAKTGKANGKQGEKKTDGRAVVEYEYVMFMDNDT